MKTLLVMTVGQTDVQLVVNNQRHKLDGNTCGALHDAVNERSWSVVDASQNRSRDFIKVLSVGTGDLSTEELILGIEGKPEVVPIGEDNESAGENGRKWESRRIIEALSDAELKLCTPKLDAVLEKIGTILPTSTLIFETNRQGPRDPRLSGEVMERRLRDRGVKDVTRVAFLTGTEQLEDPSNEVDAVVRSTVVAKISDAIRMQVEQLTKNDQVFVATTGGLAAANELINEMVRLHAVSGPTVTALEVPDRERVQGEDRAVEEKFHPAAGFRARWHALSLIEKGNLLGAWGAVSHLKDEPGQGWTQVIEWLAQFASSMPFEPPLLPDSDLMVLNHKRMAVRAALRVELALCAGDIPRAVHGTVAFFEAALWDWLRQRDFSKEDGAAGSLDSGFTFATKPTGEKKDRFNNKGKINDRKEGVNAWLSVLGKPELTAFWNTISDGIRNLRNDVAHNEPTLTLMNEARTRMQAAQLWSNTDKFLSQPVIQNVLKELGEPCPEQLCSDLVATVRERLLAIS